MKKMLAILLVSLFLLGSFPMALAEEAHAHDGCCETHAHGGGIVPLWDCDHSYGTHEQAGTHISGCLRAYYTRVICDECGKIVDTIGTYYVPNSHVGNKEWRNVPGPAFVNYEAFCDRCNYRWDWSDYNG